jgi:isoleucyl-tRNA synthetase
MVLGHVADREGKKESKSKGNYTPPEVILDRVRLEFAVVAPRGEACEAGRATLAREDYEGLDLRGGRAKVRVYRTDDPARGLELEIRPGRLPRRVIALADADRAALDLEPSSASVLPREVPGMPPANKVWVEDPSTPAPGADAFRWFFFASNPPWNPTRHSLGAVRALQRELPLKLRNVYAFFTIYANVDGFDPSEERCRAGRPEPAERPLVDRWILSELALANARVIDHMDAFRLYEATEVLTGFADALSNWYVRRNRDRFWAPGLEPDKLAAHWTLYECLVTATRLLAPFLPFATEEAWQNLVRRPFPDSERESVHFCDYPEPDPGLIDRDLSRVMDAVRELVSLGLQVRTAEKLRVRQPLEAAEIVLAEPELRADLGDHIDLIRDELNVHEVHFVPNADDYVTYRVKPNFRALGPRLGRKMPALKAALAEAAGASLLRQLEAEGRVRVPVEGEELALGADEIAVSLEARPGFSAAGGRAGVVVLRTTLTPSLVEEGLFREVLNRVQTFRKELDLEFTARIRLTLAGAPRLVDAVRPRVEELGRETLSVDVALDAPPVSGAHVREAAIDGDSLTLGLTLAAES